MTHCDCEGCCGNRKKRIKRELKAIKRKRRALIRRALVFILTVIVLSPIILITIIVVFIIFLSDLLEQLGKWVKKEGL